MVLGVYYNSAALGKGLSGTVIDLQDEVAVKMYHDEGLHQPRLHRDREAHYLRELSGTELNAPEYIAQGEHADGRNQPMPTLTMSRLSADFYTHEDVIIRHLDVLAPLGHDIGSQLAKLHSLKPARLFEDKQKSVLQLMLEQTQEFDVKAGARDSFYRGLERKIVELEATVKPVFCHGDFNFANVGFDENTGKISALIDFAYSGYGMPETDFLYLQEPDLFPAAVEAYEKISNIEISPERLKLVGLVNNMRALVTFEGMLSGELSDEEREHFESEYHGCFDDILETANALDIQDFVFSSSPAPKIP